MFRVCLCVKLLYTMYTMLFMLRSGAFEIACSLHGQTRSTRKPN